MPEFTTFAGALLQGFTNLGCLWPEDQGGGALLRDCHRAGRVNADPKLIDAAWRRLLDKREEARG